MAAEEADAKRRRTDEAGSAAKAEEEDVAMKVPQEQEEDAKPEKRALLGKEVRVEPRDATLNVVPALGGRILMPLTDGGLQYLIAGARANVGIRKGRYMFEVKIVEALNPSEPASSRSSRTPMPRQLVRVGFSTQDSSLFLGETEDSVCFDSEGFYTADKKRNNSSQRFSRDQTIGVLLNLDRKSPNADTVSIFRDGERVSQPQPIPEYLQGKPLFPHVNFKNVTLQVNFGPSPMAPLPFTCRMAQELAKDDAVTLPPTAQDSKCEVVFPVGLPDEGTFEWLDSFLEDHPQYVELSDRAILRWAERSGLWRPKTASWKNSNDKPDMNFGIPMMDDFSVRRVLNSVIATQPRNYVVMEVKSNLITEERAELMRRFGSTQYKKVAMVVMGEPSDSFKGKVQESTLKEKQEQMEQEWRQRKVERERRKTFELQQKQLEEAKKRVEEESRRKAEEAAKPMEVDQAAGGEAKKEEGEAKKAEGEVKKEEAEGEVKKEGEAEVKKEAEAEVKKEEEPAKGEAKEEPAAQAAKEEEKEESEEEPAPNAELTKEEKALWFKKKATTDLTMWVLSTNFPRFTMPEKAEGFDEIRYAWQREKESQDYLKAYILKNKVLCRIEDLQPSEWFRAKWTEWQKVLQEWHSKQSDFKDPIKMAEKRAAEEAAAAKKAAEAEKAEGEKKEGEAGEAKEEEAKEEEKMDIDDIFSVEDVCNVGKGEPLFARFAFEDWALLSLRLELHLLVHAFKRDVSDPERIGIHEQHMNFYYNKYYRKTFNTKYYGVDTNFQLVDMVKDTVSINPENHVLTPQLSDDMDNFDLFVKLTEENRRERQRRIDAGDETVKLKFSKPEAPPQKGVQQAPRQYPGPSVGGQPKGGAGKGYYPPRGPQQQPSWLGGGGGSKGSYGGKSGGYGGPPAPVGGKGYGGQQPGYGSKGYGGQRYGKGYGK